MSSYANVYFLFSCLLLYATAPVFSSKNLNLDDFVQKNLTVRISNENDYIVDATFKKTEKCSICVSSKTKSFDKVYVLYTVMSCKFAKWTLNEICNFIKRISDLRTNSSLVPTDDDFSNLKIGNFEFLFNCFKSSIKMNVNRFVNILNDYLDIHENSSYYFDTYVIETLMSLQIQIEYFSLDIEMPAYFDTSRELYTMRLILKDLTALQSVLLLNCAYEYSVSADNADRTRFWYWITADEDISAVNRQPNINTFLSSIEEFEFKSDLPDGVATQTILEMFKSPITDNDYVTRDCIIAASETKRDFVQRNQNVVTVKDVLSRIQITCDVELILFYQNFVLTAMIKSFFDRFAFALQRGEVPKVVQQNVTQLYKAISEDRSNLPSYLVDGFGILEKCFTEKEPPLDRLNTFTKSLDIIESEKGQPASTESTEADNLTEFLENLLDTITEKIVDVQLFVRKSRKCLRVNHYTYFTMHKTNFIPVTIPLVQTEIDHFERVCTFVSSMHSMFHKVLELVRQQNDSQSSANKDHGIRILTKVQTYFIVLIRNLKNDACLLKMALKITPLLVDLLRQWNTYFDEYKTVRILDVIITELKNNGIHYCAPSLRDILLFNRVEELKASDDELFDSEVMRFFQATVGELYEKDLSKDIVNFSEYKFFNLESFHTNRMDKSNVYKSYGSEIQVYWNGQLKTIGDVYNDTSIFLFNPHNFYALHDISYTFYAAVVYLKIKRVIKDPDYTDGSKNEIANQLFNFEPDFFPRRLSALIGDIKNLLFVNDSGKKLDSILDKINAQFSKLNIVFPNNFISLRCYMFTSCISSLKRKKMLNTIKIVNDEILKNLGPVRIFKEYTVRN